MEHDAITLHVERNGFRALRRRNIQGRQSFRADDAIPFQPVAKLKADDCADRFRVERVTSASGMKIAQQQEAFPDCRHGG